MIDLAKAVMFPAPKPRAPLLSSISKKNVSWDGKKMGFVNI